MNEVELQALALSNLKDTIFLEIESRHFACYHFRQNKIARKISLLSFMGQLKRDG
jgi:hypothetical protein